MASSEAMTALSSYVPGTRAWFTDKDLGWISATQSGKVGVNEATGEVTIEFTLDDDESQRVVKTSLEKLRGKQRDEQLPPLRNPPLLEATDDLTNLSYLNEPAVLHAILSRYSQRLIYTYSGIVLIAVNPFFALNLYSPEIIQAYSGKRRGELEPHLFAIAEDAYRCMIRDEKDQTIVVSGESGAGKTVSAKYIMRYFATVEDPDRPGSRRAAANSAAQASGTASSSAAASMSETERQILATNPIMEAFGNAKTTRNDNSSRFGKYIEILFDRNHEIVGAKIRTYLLERSRLVYQPENERNYHIFYQLCAGAPASERKELGLDDASKFHYLNQGGNKTITGVDDAKDFKETQQALGTVGLTVERQWSIFRLLAALLHLGNVEIGATRNDAMLAQDEPSLFIAAKLLGIDLAEFRKWTVKKQIVTRGEKIVSNLTQAQAVVVRDSVAKYVYSCLFDWLVDQLNHSLALGSADARKSMIGVLDIYGFERFKVNSFEQFCINYANERLQHEFNRHVFKLEQDEYMAEEISWTFIDFSDNQPTIDMIESRLGILSLLDEESRLPSGADASFLQKLYTQMERKPEYKNSFKKPRFGQSAFTVCHYALDVEYEVEGFLEKNRDAVPDEHLTLLGATTSNFLKEVLETATQLANAAKEQPSATAADGEKTAAAAAVRRPGAGIVKKPTLGSQFKASLVSLMTTIDATNVHYIRCIKPNEAKRAWEVEPQNVLGQLRACGVLETIRISCAGYPSRWTFADFAERYYMLVPSAHWDMTSLEKAKELAAYILKTCVDDADKYQIGLNKIFFRAGMLAQFEQRRGDRLKSLVTLIQKNLRRNIQMRKYGTMRSSSVKLQSWWRMQAAKKQVNGMRQQKAAVLLQTALRAWLAQQSYRQTLAAVVRIQSLARGRATRSRFADTRVTSAAVRLQSLFRGLLARRQFLSQRKGIVLLQSLHRRRLAKRELISLRNEAKSAKHFKEVTYKLENKVVELTQNLQKRTKENKELVARVRALEASIAEWQGKHEELDVKSRGLQTELDKPSVPLPEFEALIAAKKQLDEQHDAARRQIMVHEEKIAGLEEEVRRGAEELEARESALSKREDEDNTTATSLRAEISKLREELARAHSLAQLSGTSNGEPAGGAAATRDFNGLYDLTMGKEPTSATTANGSGRRAQRPRSADVAPGGNVRKAQAAANRHVSVMPPQQLMDRDEDAVVEEIESILLDEAQLDEDLLQGLIQQLRVPMGDDISPKECLFPSHLIALVLNEYWLRSMIRPSERVLANVMQTIQTHVMSLEGDELVTQAIYWISNVHELLSFVSVAESDLLAGITPGDNDQAFGDYERLIVLAKHDLESLEYNIYHTLIDNTKRRLHKMVVPAVIESQSLPGFIENSSGRLFNRLISSATNAAPAYTMDDVLNILNTVWRALKTYYLEAAVVHQVVTELMRLINSTAFNDLVLRRSFCSWKRAMQIQYNITRIEEWCKTKGIPEAMLQLEHLSQSVKLLQLKKSTVDDVSIIFDVSWILSPSQIHKLLASYHTAEYEQPISQEILKAAAARVVPNDRNDHLLLPPEVDEAGPYELPMPREVTGIETYIPSFIQAPSLRKLSSLVA